MPIELPSIEEELKTLVAALKALETEQGVFEALGLPCPLPAEREVVNGKPVWMPPEKL